MLSGRWRGSALCDWRECRSSGALPCFRSQRSNNWRSKTSLAASRALLPRRESTWAAWIAAAWLVRGGGGGAVGVVGVADMVGAMRRHFPKRRHDGLPSHCARARARGVRIQPLPPLGGLGSHRRGLGTVGHVCERPSNVCEERAASSRARKSAPSWLTSSTLQHASSLIAVARWCGASTQRLVLTCAFSIHTILPSSVSGCLATCLAAPTSPHRSPKYLPISWCANSFSSAYRQLRDKEGGKKKNLAALKRAQWT